MAKLDKTWFTARLADIEQSQGALARHMGMDPSAISLLLNGRRRIEPGRAEQIADFLRVPVADVLRLGLGLKVDRARAPLFPMVGTVNAQMLVTMDSPGARVEGSQALPADAVAVRLQTAGTQTDWLDGWLMFFQPARGMDPALVTRLCVAELADGSRRLGNLRRGYAEGVYNLVIGPGSMLENVTITSATPVLWIKP
jgi:hypothetical protein